MTPQPQNRPRYTHRSRRGFLQSAAGITAATVGLAGCLASPGGSHIEEGTGYAAFFALWDWAQHVGGDEFSFENPVPVGRMGHGWDPPADLIPQIASTQAFIYLDNPEFRWAQNVARQLTDDHDHVTLIDGMQAIPTSDLLTSDHDHDHDHGDDHDHDHADDHGHEHGGDNHADDHGHDHDHGDDDHADDHGHDHDHGDDDHADDHGHDHGDSGQVTFDPHVWVDPIHAQRIVNLIATTLGEVDPDHAATYDENAQAYTDRIQAVHEQFSDLLATADHSIVVLAGHDSFGYLANRYGLEFHTPVGVSPDAVESLDDVAALARTINDHGIRTVLYDPFEAPNPDQGFPAAVEVLLENTVATDAAPFTPTEGTTREWHDQGYGWIEQMTEINLPSLEKALTTT